MVGRTIMNSLVEALTKALNVSKYIVAPNYSFLLDEIIPKLTNK